MKRIFVVVTAILLAASPLYAYVRAGNLRRLTKDKAPYVYLNKFSSQSKEIDAEEFKRILREYAEGRKDQVIKITEDKNRALVYINCTILSYRYLKDDPVDQITGGTTGLIVDALVKQNYAQVKVRFEVKRTKDNRRIWHSRFPVSVTKTNMPEADSIPAVLRECAKRFMFLCFLKNNER